MSPSLTLKGLHEGLTPRMPLPEELLLMGEAEGGGLSTALFPRERELGTTPSTIRRGG